MARSATRTGCRSKLEVRPANRGCEGTWNEANSVTAFEPGPTHRKPPAPRRSGAIDIRPIFGQVEARLHWRGSATRAGTWGRKAAATGLVYSVLKYGVLHDEFERWPLKVKKRPHDASLNFSSRRHRRCQRLSWWHRRRLQATRLPRSGPQPTVRCRAGSTCRRSHRCIPPSRTPAKTGPSMLS